MPPSILTIQHTRACPPARVGDWLEAAGCTPDVRRCFAGDPLPTDLADHDGLLVLGGEMGAYDDDRHPWLGPTKALLSEAVRRDLPTLAVCLGLQLLAVTEGGTVSRMPSPQVGLCPVVRTAEAVDDPLFGPVADDLLAIHWNNDLVTGLPAGAVVLSRTDAGVQALRIGAAVWGVQFHPEVDAGILEDWAAADVAAGHLAAAEVEAHLAAVARADPEHTPTWSGLSRRFAAVVQQRAGSAGPPSPPGPPPPR